MYVLQNPDGEYLRLRAASWGNEIYYRLVAGKGFEQYPIFSVANKLTADNVSRFTEVIPVRITVADNSIEIPFKIVNPFWEICKVVEMRQA